MHARHESRMGKAVITCQGNLTSVSLSARSSGAAAWILVSLRQFCSVACLHVALQNTNHFFDIHERIVHSL